jgi:hypothetical protein
LDVHEVCPRLVWGHHARTNRGRRRPHGRHEFYKYKPVFFRGPYSLPMKPRLVGPKLEEVIYVTCSSKIEFDFVMLGFLCRVGFI